MIRAFLAGACTAAIGIPAALGAGNYGPGVTDTEIKIGQTAPFSGAASAYSAIAKAEAAYFAMVNEQGGVNGRRIKLITLDDGYSPPKTVEQTRRLVEEDQVLLIFNTIGTAASSAVQKYLNSRGVPQLFVASGASKWNDPQHYPWSMGWQLSYYSEGRAYAKYALSVRPNAKIGVLYQNDDYGKDYLRGIRDGAGEPNARAIVAEISYEASDPSVDSQIVSLKASGADVFIDIATPKFAAQVIRKAADIDWHPMHLLNTPAASVAATFKPAGMERSAGIINAAFLKDPADPSWRDDAGVNAWRAWMKQYLPDADPADAFNVYGYTLAQTLVEVLKRCGNDLTRESVMRKAATLNELELPMLLPGIRLSTSATDFLPVKKLQMRRFDGARWVPFGGVMTP
jgi:branched-chain amino acid transport system substrate-binding protein